MVRGREGEDAVAAALVSDGWSVIARNWRGAGGELDLVALKNGRLRFVEVKTRSVDDPVGIEAIGNTKRQHLIRAAEAWLRSHEPEVDEMAFLVAMVQGADITWYDDAFDVE